MVGVGVGVGVGQTRVESTMDCSSYLTAVHTLLFH